MTVTAAFLQAILPADGLKCLVHILPGQSPRQYFYETCDQLAAAILRCDSQGGSVYHGCASYSRRGRRKDDVEFVRAFWLDVDLSPKSSYVDAEAAFTAVAAFAVHLGIRTPLVVSSGNGLHCYWPLRLPIDRATWERYARGLKLACEVLGMDAGRERTGDCASILRPPGTYWRKDDPPRLVEMGEIPEPFELEELNVFLEFANNVGIGNPPAPIRQTVKSRSGLAAKVIEAKALEVVDFEVLASECAQVGLLRETRGNLSEPIWHAHTVLFAHAENGDLYGHLWSDGHPNYSFDETQSYLDRGRQRSGPTTCAHFRAINPETCKGCPHQVSTPLGIPTGKPKVILPKEIEDTAPDLKWKDRKFEGFAYNADGALVVSFETNNGEAKQEIICAQPVYLDAVQKGELRSGQHFYRFRHYLPHRGWQSVDLSAGQARGQNVGAIFADLGLNMRDPEAFRRFIAQSVDHFNKERDMDTQFEQYGWKPDDGFLYGNRLYTAKATIEVPASKTMQARNQYLRPKEGGSLAGWREAANQLFGAGSEGQSYAILSAFAAPLTPFVTDEGGTCVSLVTRASSPGKTTSIQGAYTVFASDKRGLVCTLIDTANSTPESLALLCHLPVFHDEFRGDPEILNRKISEFTEGLSKQRLDRDGQLRNSVGKWATTLIIAGNQSVVDAIGGLNGSNAMAYRIMEFAVESGGNIGHVEADRLKKILEANAGHAGHAFLEYLVRPDVLAWVKANLPVYHQQIVDYGKFGKAERFWTRQMACVAVASQIIAHLGLVAFSPDRILRWAVDYFVEVKRPATRDAKDFLALFLNQYAAETLVVQAAFNKTKKFGVVSERLPNKLTIRREQDTGTTYIDFDTLRKWLIKHEVSIFEFGRDLEKQGISRGFKYRTLGAGTNLGGGSIKVLDIDGEHPAFSGVARLTEAEKRLFG